MLQDDTQLVVEDVDKYGDDRYYELLLGRELYGHLLTLAWRPMSTGNDVAVSKGWELVRLLLSRIRKVKGVIFTDTRLELIESILDEDGALSGEDGARIVVSALAKLVSVPFTRNYTDLYDEEWWPAQDLDRVIVSVGPTIGIGDELLMARALVGKLAPAGVTLEVESERADLWTMLEPRILSLGAPPLGAHLRIIKLAHEARARTMVLRADFLPSDPSPRPWYMPPGLAVTAGWTFGNCTATAVDSINCCVRNIQYPPGLPESRVLESQWVVTRLLQGVGSTSEKSPVAAPCKRPPRGSKPSVFFHVLTSKPELMLDPEFYAGVFSSLRSRLGWLPDITLLGGPTPSTLAICDSVANAVSATVPGINLKITRSLEFSGIRQELERASLSFGPDTFTGHVAAMKHIPQVTLQLTQHHAWINPGTPSFIVPLLSDSREVISMATELLVFVLQAANGELSPRWSEWGAEWRSYMAVINKFVEMETREKPVESTLEVGNALDRLHSLAKATPEPLIERTNQLPSRVELSRYASPFDAWRAVVRWYIKMATSNASAAAYVMES
jgi:hypothetical protein